MGIPHYLIVGGGLSGLITSYFISLIRSPGTYRLTVLESSNRWGGWIRSVKNPNTGSIYEAGPHSARVKSSAAVRKPFTRSIFDVIIRRLFSGRPPSQSDWTVDEFLRSRFDSEFADYIGSALIRGIFAGDSRNLSVRACLPMLVKSEECGPNLILGLLRSKFNQSLNSNTVPTILDEKLPHLNNLISSNSIAWNLSGGLETLIDTMADSLNRNYPHIKLHLNSSVEKLKLKNDHYEYTWRNVTNGSDQKKIDKANSVFLCCPSFVTAEILEDVISSETLSYLKPDRLPWEDVVSAVLEVDGSSFTPSIRGFGHLVPRPEDAHILGVIYDSFAFPQLDGDGKNLRYTVMMKPHSDWLESSKNFSSVEHLESVIEEVSRNVLIKHLKIPNPVIVGRHIRVLRNCIPQYPPGHLNSIASLRNEICQVSSGNNSVRKGLYLVGNSYDGVGLTDTVQSAANAVVEEFKSLS
ncbi:unnamed protein product [Heterobilharzia americana]|nr:unnamed protein product [Heterobilharzia americana]